MEATMLRAIVLLGAGVCAGAGLVSMRSAKADDISERARKIHFSSIVVDTHDDTTQRLVDEKFDLGHRDARGHIDAVREQVRRHADDLVLATTAEEVRRAYAQHKIAALMGMEGGHMIDNDLGLLRMYAALGVRYLTLTHGGNTEWADSSTDRPAHNGLTDFGKDVVRELNRLGVLVDISHVSDRTFYDALEVSKAPMIASHSSCRALCDAPRNMTDDMIKAL